MRLDRISGSTFPNLNRLAAWNFQDTETSTLFDTTGASSYATTKTFTRANPKHLQLTQLSEVNSDGTQRITNLKYPADYLTDAGNAEAIALTAMQDTFNIHNAVIERYVIKRAGGTDSVVQGDITTYKLAAAGTAEYLPYQRFSFNNPGPLVASSYVPSAVSGSFTKDSHYLTEETANTYDGFGRLTQLTDARSQVTNYAYGGNVNNAFLISVTKVHDASGPVNLVTNVAYGTDNQVTSIQDEGATFRRFTYDPFGRLRQIQNNGSTAVKSYGYTYSRTSPSWTFNAASPNAVTDTSWLQVGTGVPATQYIDGLGRTIQSVVKENASTFHVSSTEYDQMGRLWKTWKPYTRASGGYDASFKVNDSTFYNSYLGVTQARPYVETLYRTEPASQVSKVIPEWVGASTSVFTQQGYGIDAVNKQQIVETTDESAKKTRGFTDVFGNGVKTILGFGAAEATTTTLTPNILGQRIKVLDPRSLQTSYTLDTRGLLTARTSPDAGTVSSKYDNGRNLRFAQDANQAALGTVAFTNYDFANRPLNSGVGAATFSSLDPNAAPTALETTNTNWLVVRQYDAKPNTANFPWSRFSTQITPLTLSNVSGRLSAVASKSNGAWQVTLFSYDSDGRVAKRYVYTEANGGASVLTNLNTSITYARDLRDAVTQRSDTTGTSFFYQWYDYDGRGLLWKGSAASTNVKPGTPDVTYTYRPSGQVASRLYSGGPTVPITYTIREQLLQIGDPAGTTYPFSGKYSYNANSTISTGEFYSGGSPATNKRYKFDFPTYDALNRLKSADYSFWNGSAWTASTAYDLPSISYDANGNLTALQRNKETGALIDNLTYTIAPASNRLNSLTDAVGATAETWDAETGSFTYDANGNQLTAPAPYSITATTYDPRNLPLSITIAGTTTNYRYDDAGQRITKQVGAGNTEVYLKEGTTTLGVFTVNSGGTIVSSYFNLLAGDRVVGRQPSAGSRSYYHTDLLGSTRSVVQGASVTESYDPDPWGVLMPGRTLGSGTKELFTSKERDAESQMDYFGARYYLAAVGRWASVDPAPYADRAPAWSPFAYVRDEPAGVMDLWGLQGCSIENQKNCAVFTGGQARAVFATLQKGSPAIRAGIVESAKFAAYSAVGGEVTGAILSRTVALGARGVQAWRAARAATMASEAGAVAANQLATGIDEAVFWSGLGRGGADEAAAWVAQNGGTTLENTLTARGIRLPAWDAGNPESVAAWRRAAREFAAGARGNVRVLQGDVLRLDAIWVDEFKALQGNPNVSSIRAVNPRTGAEAILWSK